MAPTPTLAFVCEPHNATAVNVLAGSLDAAEDLRGLDVRFLTSQAQVADWTRACQASGEPAVVAWSFYSPDFERCANALRRVKGEAAPANVRHLAGGPHATAEPRMTLDAGFDAVAIGEGEATIRSVARAWLAGEDWTRVKGIAALRDGALASQGPGERIELDDYPAFAAGRKRLNPIEITRGCVYACSFCQTPFMFKARFRHRSVANVVEHVKIMTRGGADYVRFISPTSLSYGSEGTEPDLVKVEELLAGVRQALGSRGKLYFGTFPSEIRPEHVTPRALEILRRHCSNRNLVIGGQSGSEAILTTSRRGHGVDAVERAVRYSLEAGFTPNVDFVLGLPGETAADLSLTLDFAEKLADLGARIHAHTFMPLPGTPSRGAAPGRVSEETLTRLERLGSRQRLYGQWKRQAAIAESLARMRSA